MSILQSSAPTINPTRRTRKPATHRDATLDRATLILEALVRPTLASVVPVVSSVAELAKSLPMMPERFDRPSYDIAAMYPDGFPLAAPKAVPVVSAPATQAAEPINFDVTTDDGIVKAFNPSTGNTVRFRISTQTWGEKTVRVVSFDDGSKFVNFAFVDEFGVRPWGMNAKTSVPFDMRPKYARFLENLKMAAERGVELTITRNV